MMEIKIVTQKVADFEPEKFEDHYDTALIELINAKRNGRTIRRRPDPRAITLQTSWTR
jgi:DNA end-binding protein Ku